MNKYDNFGIIGLEEVAPVDFLLRDMVATRDVKVSCDLFEEPKKKKGLDEIVNEYYSKIKAIEDYEDEEEEEDEDEYWD